MRPALGNEAELQPLSLAALCEGGLYKRSREASSRGETRHY